jgi:hypothetical protein
MLLSPHHSLRAHGLRLSVYDEPRMVTAQPDLDNRTEVNASWARDNGFGDAASMGRLETRIVCLSIVCTGLSPDTRTRTEDDHSTAEFSLPRWS